MSITAYLISLDLIFIPILLIALALGVAWLANRPQPTPDPQLWEDARARLAMGDRP